MSEYIFEHRENRGVGYMDSHRLRIYILHDRIDEIFIKQFEDKHI